MGSQALSVCDLEDAGIVTNAGRVWRNRFLNGLSIALPLAGSVFALIFCVRVGYSAVAWSLFAIFFFATAFGITIGLHRHFTHRSFKANKVVRWVLAILGTSAFQGPIVRWVADHRRHHRFTDERFDPHSPHYDLSGPLSGRKGFLHAHFTWMLTGLVSDEQRYAADIRTDGMTAWVSRCYWPIAIGFALLPSVIGYFVGGIDEVFPCLLLAGCARVSLLHQLTWSVNSLGHTVGNRPVGARDQSRDNIALALLIVGEGLHGYHHKNPAAAICEPKWADASGALIRLLEKAGWVWAVR